MLRQLISVAMSLAFLVSPAAPQEGELALWIDGREICRFACREALKQTVEAVQRELPGEPCVILSSVSVVLCEEKGETPSEADAVRRIRAALCCRTVETVVIAVPPPREEVSDPTLPVGKTRTLFAGSPGKSRVTRQVVRRGGQVLYCEVLEQIEEIPPTAQRLAVGTLPTLSHPVEAYLLTSDYGPRAAEFHTGTDFAATYQTPVLAAGDATVLFAGWQGGYGNLVKLDHGNGLETWYAHNDSLSVSVGEKVRRGMPIAAMGSTGNSTGPHCHFEVRLHGEHQNPWEYLEHRKPEPKKTEDPVP